MGIGGESMNHESETNASSEEPSYLHAPWERVSNSSLPPLVIAEMSANHLGSLDRAIDIIKAAKKAGADVVKFQHYLPDTITTKSNHPDFAISGESLWAGRDLWSLYEEAMMPWEWTADLVTVCKEIGLFWFSSPFDETAVDFLEQFDPPMYKVASFEIIDIPLIEKIARTGKPMIISTGMATEGEITEAVNAATSAGNPKIALLRTNSAYPAPVDEMDLRAIPYIAEKWGVPVGLSDHTLDHTSAIVATALEARIFEKHLTLRRSDGGPDAAFSLEPEEFSDYVRKINDAFSSLGTARLGPSPRERDSLRFRPSIRAIRDINQGDLLTLENIATVRPAGGLPPKNLNLILGLASKRPMKKGEPITRESLGA
jgi:pseudaminic acid synthase